jgi:hypothetical protein
MSIIWGIEPVNDDKRADCIIAALQNFEWESMVDIACGEGVVPRYVKKEFPDHEVAGVDINQYRTWGGERARFIQMPLQEFIRDDRMWDVVVMLNSYRNWEGPEKQAFNAWLDAKAKYFITSGKFRRGGTRIGMDLHDFPIKLYKLKP